MSKAKGDYSDRHLLLRRSRHFTGWLSIELSDKIFPAANSVEMKQHWISPLYKVIKWVFLKNKWKTEKSNHFGFFFTQGPNNGTTAGAPKISVGFTKCKPAKYRQKLMLGLLLNVKNRKTYFTITNLHN